MKIYQALMMFVAYWEIKFAGLLALDNKLGNPPLRIIKPNLPYQAEFQGEQFETQVVEETKKRRTQK